MNWKAEFGSVKKATDLVLSDLRNLANSGDWEELMEQAKAYDQSIRKGSVSLGCGGWCWRWWRWVVRVVGRVVGDVPRLCDAAAFVFLCSCWRSFVFGRVVAAACCWFCRFHAVLFFRLLCMC